MTHPILAVLTWARKHWLLVLVILFLLYCVGTLSYYLFTFFKRVSELFGQFFPASLAKSAAKVATAVYNAIIEHQWIVAAAVLIVFPPVGWLIVAWLLIDKSKSTPVAAVPAAADNTDATPAIIPPEFNGFE